MSKRYKAWVSQSNITMLRELLDAETDPQKHRALAEALAKEKEELG